MVVVMDEMSSVTLKKDVSAERNWRRKVKCKFFPGSLVPVVTLARAIRGDLENFTTVDRLEEHVAFV